MHICTKTDRWSMHLLRMLFMNIVVHTHIYTHPCVHEHIHAHVCEHVHEQMFKNSVQVIPSTGTMSEAAEVMPWTSMKKNKK